MTKGTHNGGGGAWSPRAFAADADRHYLEAANYVLDAESAAADLVEALRALAISADVVRVLIDLAADVASAEADPKLQFALGHLTSTRESLDRIAAGLKDLGAGGLD